MSTIFRSSHMHNDISLYLKIRYPLRKISQLISLVANFFVWKYTIMCIIKKMWGLCAEIFFQKKVINILIYLRLELFPHLQSTDNNFFARPKSTKTNVWIVFFDFFFSVVSAIVDPMVYVYHHENVICHDDMCAQRVFALLVNLIYETKLNYSAKD